VVGGLDGMVQNICSISLLKGDQMEILLYLYLGAGLFFAAVLFLMNAESHGVVYDILWIAMIALLWPIFFAALCWDT
jgi:hypothetical protein